MASTSSTLNKIMTHAIKSFPSMVVQGNVKFFYLKHGAIQRIPNKNSICLRIKQTIGQYISSKMDMTQVKKFPFLSIWSMNHLNSLLLEHSNQNTKNVSICNPFKAYDLVEHSLRSGVQEMVIQDLDQLEKIQEIKYQIMKSTKINLNTKYLWNIQDLQQDLELLENMSRHSLFIHGVTCSIRLTEKRCQLERFLKKLLKMGHPIGKLTIRTQVSQYLKKMDQFKQFQVPVQFQLCNIDHTASFNVLCRVLGHDRQRNPVISEQCRQLISTDQKQILNVLEINGQQWLSGKPTYLNLNKAKVVDLTL